MPSTDCGALAMTAARTSPIEMPADAHVAQHRRGGRHRAARGAHRLVEYQGARVDAGGSRIAWGQHDEGGAGIDEKAHRRAVGRPGNEKMPVRTGAIDQCIGASAAGHSLPPPCCWQFAQRQVATTRRWRARRVPSGIFSSDSIPVAYSSRRTFAAPSASACNLPNAVARGRYFMPQSGAATSRSAGM